MIAAHGSFVYIGTYFMQTKANKRRKYQLFVVLKKKTIYFDVYNYNFRQNCFIFSNFIKLVHLNGV